MLKSCELTFPWAIGYFQNMGDSNSDNRIQWDKLCERCARCCYEKIAFEDKVYYTDIPCQYLDLNTRLCKVYGERDKVRKGCVKLTPELLSKGFLPADCPYVKDLENYQAPLFADEVNEEDE